MPASTSSPDQPFPTRRLDTIEPQNHDRLWLVDELWLREGVGVLGGPPKHFKTWLAAELALSVATGAPAFGRYQVQDSGTVLFFGAEDHLSSLRTRFEGIARLRGIPLDDVPLYLLDVMALRLDTPGHRSRLAATLRHHQPRLLVLDPLVRIAAIDENSATEVSAVLGALRHMQRRFHVAILLVHHTRKAAGSSPTLAFRGSGDFGAWSDSNLILSRSRTGMSLTIEHRSARAPDPLRLHFHDQPAPHLALIEDPDSPSLEPIDDELESAVLACLPTTGVPRPTTALREQLHRRKADVLEALGRLRDRGHVERTKNGWRRALPPPPPT